MSETQEKNRHTIGTAKQLEVQPLDIPSPLVTNQQPSPSESLVQGTKDSDSATNQQSEREPRRFPASEIDIVAGIAAILGGIREDIRSYRVAFLSNLILAFTIPLSALAVQHPEIFDTPALWLIPWPKWWIFSFWLLGVASMLYGLVKAFPSLRMLAEGFSTLRAREAAEFLSLSRASDAVRSLNEAVSAEDDRLKALHRSRIPFLVTFVLFLLCVGFEFALVLFR